jgi:hypothetical protein
VETRPWLQQPQVRSQSTSIHPQIKPIVPYHLNKLTIKKLCADDVFVHQKEKGVRRLQIPSQKIRSTYARLIGPIKSKHDDDDVDFAHTHATLANQIKLRIDSNPRPRKAKAQNPNPNASKRKFGRRYCKSFFRSLSNVPTMVPTSVT